MDTFKTKTIFRTWKTTGDVIALFPEIPADRMGYDCMSYMRVGQHSGADYTGLTLVTRPATPEEIEPLAKELAAIGYNVEQRLKETPAMRANRIGEARQ